ncbi:MAG: hypothetical protein ACM31C_18840, partial [Acidobacteriota bacterium]
MPYIHVVVNNACLGSIRQAQRGSDMVYSPSTTSTPSERGGYGVDNVPVVEGLGRKAIRAPAGGDGPGDPAGGDPDEGVPRAGRHRGDP